MLARRSKTINSSPLKYVLMVCFGLKIYNVCICSIKSYFDCFFYLVELLVINRSNLLASKVQKYSRGHFGMGFPNNLVFAAQSHGFIKPQNS